MQSSNKLNFEIAIANLPIIYIYVLFEDCYTILKSTHLNLKMFLKVVRLWGFNQVMGVQSCPY